MMLNNTIQRASEKNLMDYCREGFEKIKNVLKELENVTIEQKGDEEFEAINEDIQALLGKVNELQNEINEMRDKTGSSDTKTISNHMNELEKKIDKKIAENKSIMQESNKKVVDILAKLQEEFEKLKSKIYVNRD